MSFRMQQKGAVAWITLENPPMNQVDNRSRLALLAELDRLAADPGVRALVLSGSGEQAFCAGADIRELADLTTEEAARAYAAGWDELYRRIREFPGPTVAAVNGYALGGGFEILLNTDIRIAVEHARLGCTAANIGLVTSLHSLAAHLPLPLAREMFFTARHLEAEEALRFGLVNRVVPVSELAPVTEELVERMLQRAPLALQEGKRLFQTAPATARNDHDRQQQGVFARLVMTEDHREAVQAFLEKRRPQFRGR